MSRFTAALCAALLAFAPIVASAAEPPREPYGINLEGFAYPYPVSLLPLVNDGEMSRRRSRTAAPCCCCTAATFRRATGRP